jgi:5'-3' exonuclease
MISLQNTIKDKPKNEIQLKSLIDYRIQNNVDEYLTPDVEFMKVALIDADSIPYRASHITTTLFEAFLVVHNSIQDILRDTKCSHFVLFHTTKGNFRDKVVDNYKANRAANTKTPFYYEVRDMMQILYNSTAYGNYEADDLVTMAHRKLGVYKSVLVSPDKDLLQVYPGVIFNPTKRVLIVNKEPIGSLTETIKHSEAGLKKTKITGQGTKFLFFQMLIGDTTDNIKGVPRVGPVKAYATLNDCKTLDDMYNATYIHYLSYYKTQVEALKQIQINFKLLYMQSRDSTFRIPKPIKLEQAYDKYPTK